MEWVESTGGPIVLLPAQIAASWTGALGADYDSVCESCGPVWFVNVERGGVVGLALCEPNRTGYTLLPDGSLVLVQWIAATEGAIEALVGQMNTLPWSRTDSRELTGGDLVLFDSAMSGADLPTHTSSDAAINSVGHSLRVFECEVDEVGLRLYCLRLVGPSTDARDGTLPTTSTKS